jgi:hypothetical protein
MAPRIDARRWSHGRDCAPTVRNDEAVSRLAVYDFRFRRPPPSPACQQNLPDVYDWYYSMALLWHLYC